MGLGHGCSSAIHDAFTAQLEAAGAFPELIRAHACAQDEASLLAVIERLPLPDGPSVAVLRLLNAAAAAGHAPPAPLPPSSLDVLQCGAESTRLAAHLHAAAATRAASVFCHELALDHHIAAMRLAAAAADWDLASKSHDAARQVLSERLAPQEKMRLQRETATGEAACSEARKAQHRALNEMQVRLKKPDAVDGGGAAAIVMPAVPPKRVLSQEEAAEGKVLPATLLRLAAAK